MTWALLIIPFLAWTNRFRGSGWIVPFLNGGGWIKTDLPGGPAIFPSVFVLFALVLIGMRWVDAGLLACIYLLWAILPSDWGESHDMGRSAEPNDRGFIGRLVERWIVSPDRQPLFDRIAWTIRQYPTVLFIPASWVLGISFLEGTLIFVSLAAVVLFAYALAFRVFWGSKHIEPTTFAELLAGVGWGTAFYTIHSLQNAA